MNESNFTATMAAARMGYKIPLVEAGLMRWETDGFAFVEAASHGDGGLTVKLGHAVQSGLGGQELLAAVTIDRSGRAVGAMIGEPSLEPPAIFERIMGTLARMGPPVVIDTL